MIQKFSAKIWETGNSLVLTIPKSIIESNNLQKNEDLIVSIERINKEVDTNEGDKNNS